MHMKLISSIFHFFPCINAAVIIANGTSLLNYPRFSVVVMVLIPLSLNLLKLGCIHNIASKACVPHLIVPATHRYLLNGLSN